MNSIRTVTVATLILTGIAAAQAAEEIPAWRTDGFIMEEIVVTAVAPTKYSIEEIMVPTEAPADILFEEIVVAATAPQIEISFAALELPEIVVTPVPIATRLQNMRDVRHF